MGNEILRTGDVNVYRADIDGPELLNIRKGNVPYEEVITMADDLFEQLNTSYKNSTLPHSVNSNLIDELSVQMIEMFTGVKF